VCTTVPYDTHAPTLVDNLWITNVPCGTLGQPVDNSGPCAKPVDNLGGGGGAGFPVISKVPTGIQKRGKMGLTTVSLCIPVTH
jgi:hypothetical protein